MFKWAEFSVQASKNNLSIDKVINKVLEGPITTRNIAESKRLYKNILQREGQVYCVWSGRKISNYDIDHLIPFSVWKNNDLWNLLPSDSKVNNQKSDKIPSPILIERQKDLILTFWEMIYENQSNRFQKEIQVALLGNHSFDQWKEVGIEQLKITCSYLIQNRGFESWEQ